MKPKINYKRLVTILSEIIKEFVSQYGAEDFIKKLSEPIWLQAIGYTAGLGWFEAGSSDVVLLATNDALKKIGGEVGVFASLSDNVFLKPATQEIIKQAQSVSLDPAPLLYASTMTTRVDSYAVIDGYRLTHHLFVFSKDGSWAVANLAVDADKKHFRKYLWHSGSLKNFVDAPHTAICGDHKEVKVIDMTAKNTLNVRECSTDIAKQFPETTLISLKRFKDTSLPKRFCGIINTINIRRMSTLLFSAYGRQPKNFEELMFIDGVDENTIATLGMLTELIYGMKVSKTDPANFSMALSGYHTLQCAIDLEAINKELELIESLLKADSLKDEDKRFTVKRLQNMIE